MGDDLAIDVDVGFGDGGDVFEFQGTDWVWGGGGRVKGESSPRSGKSEYGVSSIGGVMGV